MSPFLRTTLVGLLVLIVAEVIALTVEAAAGWDHDAVMRHLLTFAFFYLLLTIYEREEAQR
jgi:hypothetical protein